MTDWNWELKIFDTSASKFISGLEMDDIEDMRVSFGITDTIGEFEFDFMDPTTALGPEDVIIFSAGQRGSSIIRRFIGKIEKPVETGDLEDRYYHINGRQIAKILIASDAPEVEFSSTQQYEIIRHIVSSISYVSNQEWVSNEPINIFAFDQWQDLIVPHITSGSWTVRYLGSVLSEGTDYDLDLSTQPPTGRIKFYSGEATSVGGDAYITYQTMDPLPYGRIKDSLRTFEIYTSNLFQDTEILSINTKGVNMFDGIADVCLQTTVQYDFYLDENMTLHSQGKQSGDILTYEYDDFSELDAYNDSSFVINETLVKNVGGGTYDFYPEPLDLFTEFDNGVDSQYWSTMSQSIGLFGISKFNTTSSQASTNGGRFQDNWVGAYTSAIVNGMVGDNFVRGWQSSDSKVLRVQKSFPTPISSLGPEQYHNKTRFFGYGDPAYDDVLSRVEAHTTESDKWIGTFVLESGDFPGTETSLGAMNPIGNPTWTSIDKIVFLIYDKSVLPPQPMEFNVDGLRWGDAPIQAESRSIASQQAYGVIKTNGIIPYPVVDNTIITWKEAKQRADAIIAQYAEPIGIIEKVYFDDGNWEIKPGNMLKAEKSEKGLYYGTTRVTMVTHKIDGNIIETEVECKASTPAGIESYVEELEVEIRRLEMREQ